MFRKCHQFDGCTQLGLEMNEFWNKLRYWTPKNLTRSTSSSLEWLEFLGHSKSYSDWCVWTSARRVLRLLESLEAKRIVSRYLCALLGISPQKLRSRINPCWRIHKIGHGQHVPGIRGFYACLSRKSETNFWAVVLGRRWQFQTCLVETRSLSAFSTFNCAMLGHVSFSIDTQGTRRKRVQFLTWGTKYRIYMEIWERTLKFQKISVFFQGIT